MRALLYHGQSRLTVEEVETPHAGPGEVRLKIDSVGICRSDLYGYMLRNERRDEFLGPGDTLVMGHEPAGIVDELGEGVEGIELGQAVAVDPIAGCLECELCRAGETNLCPDRRVYGCYPDTPGGFAEWMVVRAANATPIRGDAPLELAALIEPLVVGEHAFRLTGAGGDARVLVVGGGVIGLGAALAAHRRGAAVVVSEPQAQRREVIAALGLTALPPGEVDALPPDFDLAFDCVARPETVAASVRAVGRSGTVMLVGIFADDVALPAARVVENETRIIGSFGYTHEEFDDVAGWIATTDVDLRPLIELRVGFDGVIGAFESYADGSFDGIRTIFKPELKEEA